MPSPDWFARPNDACWIGLDVGGANLKAADGRGRSVSVPFELWKRPAELAGAIHSLLASFSEAPVAPVAGVALTMTGELADCYATKAEGVRAIVASTSGAAGPLPVRVATTDDCWLDPAGIEREPLLAAAANWRVAARLVARATPGPGLWIDIGSTTTDAIPFAEGRVTATGATDTERLLAGELLYTGVRRTPVCAIVDRLPYRGQDCPVMAEWFATSADAWLLLGELAEDASDLSTADGRPFTRAASIDRLARCVGADRETFTEADALIAAKAIACQQQSQLAASIARQTAGTLVASGEGAFLAQLAAEPAGLPVLVIAEAAGESMSHHLPAHAASVLGSFEIAGGEAASGASR